MLGGAMPDMPWLLASSVLFHPGQCLGFLLIDSGIPAFGIERQERKTPYPM